MYDIPIFLFIFKINRKMHAMELHFFRRDREAGKNLLLFEIKSEQRLNISFTSLQTTFGWCITKDRQMARQSRRNISDKSTPPGQLNTQSVTYLPYMSLQAFQSVHTKHKPQLQRAKSPSQRNLPMLGDEDIKAVSAITFALLQIFFGILFIYKKTKQILLPCNL